MAGLILREGFICIAILQTTVWIILARARWALQISQQACMWSEWRRSVSHGYGIVASGYKPCCRSVVTPKTLVACFCGAYLWSRCIFVCQTLQGVERQPAIWMLLTAWLQCWSSLVHTWHGFTLCRLLHITGWCFGQILELFAWNKRCTFLGAQPMLTAIGAWTAATWPSMKETSTAAPAMASCLARRVTAMAAVVLGCSPWTLVTSTGMDHLPGIFIAY